MIVMMIFQGSCWVWPPHVPPSVVLDFHHWWYSPAGNLLLASIRHLLQHAGEHSSSILLAPKLQEDINFFQSLSICIAAIISKINVMIQRETNFSRFICCCLRYITLAENCLNESIIAFKGWSIATVYEKKKPHKWGMQAWFLTNSRTGYCYNLDIYSTFIQTEADTVDQNINRMHRIVMNMASPCNDIGHHLYFDNY